MKAPVSANCIDPWNTGIIELGETGWVPEEDDEWDELINQLLSSRSYNTTHRLIAELSKNDYWTAFQIDNLCRAVLENSQVGWIIQDEDLHSFYMKLLADISVFDGIIKEVWDILNSDE